MTEQQADTKAREIISQMSLKQKVYEMHGHGILRFGLSHVFTKHLKPILAGGNKKFGIISTSFFDGPRGVFSNKGATAFPTTMARGASWDIDLERRVGEAMAEEIRAMGGNYSGAVCMNLLRHPAWGRAQETYGEDPHHVGEMASALVDGIQKNNVQACAKHFAANSMENNRFGGSMNMNMRTLHEVYLPHFKKVVERGVVSIMSAYNKLNGEFCGHNKMLLTDILRNDWGFKGYVTSDWSYGLFDAQKGIEAGMNVEMPTNKVYKPGTIKKLLRDGKIKQQQIDDLIFPIISTKLLWASRKDERTYSKELLGCKEHTALAREVAEKSAVLLKNENNFLPLDKAKVKRIAVIGSLANVKQTGDHGSSNVIPAYIVTAIDGLKNYFSGTAVEVLTVPNGNLDSIKAICKNADAVIIAAGTTYLDEGEYIGEFKIRDRNNPDKKGFVVKAGILGLGGDRKYLHLHQPDIDVIHAASSVNKNIVVGLVAGSAVTVEEWHNEVPAIIETFYNGMEGGNALARILFGDVNPSGKLPFTVPKLETDLPPFDSFADSAEYGYYHGYTLFDKYDRDIHLRPAQSSGTPPPAEDNQPRYAFGYGLSYTQFQISDLMLRQAQHDNVTLSLSKGQQDTLHYSVKVKNIGNRAGAEVVQLYIGFPESKIDRPVKLLRAFSKVFLEPGELRILDFTVPVSDLAYYNPETQTWIVEKGKYEVLVGNSSRDEKMVKESFDVR
ncbi:MAG: glycoside hydrolase family 3 C-terminal domain-containing protein [Bacteroidetes bacterium]|nr:glycoside hydrolase family 3 C-terminal domain-containing protein [Bacteroidota bacterium]